jgi:(p)ppGpp synthase/HD superfamily hydrolase
MIGKAYKFAQEKHADQLDDDGLDYFGAHICHVVRILSQVTDNPDIIASAYLHDTLEDTDTTYDELVNNFGGHIANLVVEVTHVGKKDEVGYSFPNLHSREAIMIKFADRLSNISRMSSWDDKRQAHYLKKSKFWR